MAEASVPSRLSWWGHRLDAPRAQRRPEPLGVSLGHPKVHARCPFVPLELGCVAERVLGQELTEVHGEVFRRLR